ncbi:DUF4292 domain-containing protein [Membranihabitans maritimus]|uniref:DUF4292 domain-containing protein n=1 Tax=Membranihabitans maritimus TaxID=2904244 RepID=UPI001F433977|nr:DUF4292 domain-containing protein [Membranihabitans maritimus]
MENKFTQSICLIILSLLFVNCSGSKKINKSKEEFSPRNFEQFFKTIDHLEMNGKLTFFIPQEGINFNSNLTVRMSDDEIWMVGKFIGIEAFRTKVTIDSIMVLDRINRVYMHSSWQDVQQKYSPELDFFALKNLLIGNPFIVQGGQYSLFKNGDVYEFDYESETNAKLFIDIFFQNQIRQSNWLVESKDLVVEAKYDKYTNENLKNIPYFRSYIADISNTQNINIELEIKNLSFDDDLNTPFEVPDRYSIHSLLSK